MRNGGSHYLFSFGVKKKKKNENRKKSNHVGTMSSYSSVDHNEKAYTMYYLLGKCIDYTEKRE